MSCLDLRPSLDDLLDGGLSLAAEQALREHLADCPSCRAELQRSQQLRRQVAALPRSAEPARDLWPGIACQLGGERRPRSRSAWSVWMGTAAAAAMLGAVLTGMLAQPRGGGGRPAEPAAPTTVASVGPGASELERARAALLHALEQRRGTLSDETLAVVLDAAGVIDRSIAAIGGALEQHPGDAGLARRLVVAYQQEIQLLQRATRLPNEI